MAPGAEDSRKQAETVVWFWNVERGAPSYHHGAVPSWRTAWNARSNIFMPFQALQQHRRWNHWSIFGYFKLINSVAKSIPTLLKNLPFPNFNLIYSFGQLFQPDTENILFFRLLMFGYPLPFKRKWPEKQNSNICFDFLDKPLSLWVKVAILRWCFS